MATHSDPFIAQAISNLQTTQQNMRLPSKAIKRLFESFINSALPHTQEISDAITKGDIDSVKTKAHAIRGIALSLSFEEIAELCNRLEYEKSDTPHEETQQLHDQICGLIEFQSEILTGFETLDQL